MGGCQNCGPFMGTLNIRGHIIIGTQKGTIILTTTHMSILASCLSRTAEVSVPKVCLFSASLGLRMFGDSLCGGQQLEANIITNMMFLDSTCIYATSNRLQIDLKSCWQS